MTAITTDVDIERHVGYSCGDWSRICWTCPSIMNFGLWVFKGYQPTSDYFEELLYWQSLIICFGDELFGGCGVTALSKAMHTLAMAFILVSVLSRMD
jgi:hypothetical protein